MDKKVIGRLVGGAFALSATATALVAGAPAAQASANANRDGCVQHRRAVVLTADDNGRRVCVPRGQNVSVRLSVDPQRYPNQDQWWSPPTEQGRALKQLPQTLMAVRGTTLARYRAVTRGSATLASTRSVCASAPGRPTCHSMQLWTVTVIVR